MCASAFAMSCVQDVVPGVPEVQEETVVFTASVDAATKTTLNGANTEWKAGDKITIHNGTKGFEFKAKSSGAKSEFTYTGSGFSGEKFMAVYPSGTYTADVNAKTVKVNVPVWQQANKGSWNTAASVAVAYSENTSLSFKNATALLSFKVNTDNVTHVYFRGNAGETVTGDAQVTVTEEGLQVTPIKTNDGGFAEMYAWHDDNNKYFVKGQTYYLAVLPQVFKSGVKVSYRINEGAELEAKKASKEVTLNANTIYDLGTIEYVAPKLTTLYLKPNSNWTKDGARFAAYFFGNGETWVSMTDSDKDGIYEVAIPTGKTYPSVIFCRMNGGQSANNWNNKWNQTEDLTIPADGNDLYTVKEGTWDNGGGTWSKK